MQWISAKDRLPDIDQYALWVAESGFMFIREIDKDDYPWWNDNVRHCGLITHWMPLPEPPKGE